MKSAFFYFCFCTLALLSSCSKSSGPFDFEVEYIPFQEEEDGLWGMIGTDGEVLFLEEFKEEPTTPLNGRFIVKNNDGLLEYYTAEKKPRKIGDEYLEAASFVDKVAPAVRKDKAVELIDLEGNVVCTLDEVAGKRIMHVSNFSEGIAIIHTSDGYGCIDTSGKVVIKPHYARIHQCSEGKIVAVDNKYKDVEPSERKITILDKKGNVTAEFSINNLSEVGMYFKEGLLPIIVETNSGKEAGFVDEKGEWIVKPSSKMRAVSDIYDKHFIYYDGDSYGVKNIDGETVIRAKYRELRFTSDKVLVFKNEKREQGLIDINGNKLIDETFEAIYGLFQNKYFVAKTGNNWELMDIEGNSLSRKTDIYNIGISLGQWDIKSDFFSYTALFNEVGISANAFGRFKCGMTATKIAAACVEKPVAEVLPQEYAGKSSVSYGIEALGCYATIGAVFSGTMASYADDGGYRFSNKKPTLISVMFPNSGRISGKYQETFDAACDYVRTFSKLVKKDNNNAIYQTRDGKYIGVTDNDGTTGILMGNKDAINALIAPQESVAEEVLEEEEDESFLPDNHPANADAADGSLVALGDIVSTRKLVYSDISSLNKADLRLLRNTIYARHGYIFKSNDLKNYFSQYPWYSPRYTDVSGMLSGIEKYNVSFIQKYE